MASKHVGKSVAPEIDLDALLAERQDDQARSVKLFGRSHAIVAPNTPAGMLQLLELQKTAARHKLDAEGQPAQIAALMAVEGNVTAQVALLKAVVPSLQTHNDELMRLDFATLEAMADAIGVAEMMDRVMAQLGVTRKGTDETADGAAEADTTEGNLPESSATSVS